jgi:glycosyltransferase involved in cell wall biosynthesis
MKVAVVTPSIGSKHLEKCVASVNNQTYTDIVHYIFADGMQYFDSIQEVTDKDEYTKTKLIALEENVGKGWYGHRVYAACSFLVNADVIVYLDEDNWIEPTHVQTIVDTLENSTNQWVFSLRNIYDEDGEFVCLDNCESLGKWPTFFDENVYHIDTSCFAVRKDVAIQIGHAWYGQWGADRKFFGAIKQYFPNFTCTNQHTVNYRLGGNEGSVQKSFFEKGNKIMKNVYNDDFPWHKKQEVISNSDGVSIVIV